MHRLFAISSLMLATNLLFAQQALDISHEQTRNAVEELQDFVAIPNFGLHQQDILKNIKWLHEAFGKRGFEMTDLSTAGNPLFLAHMEVDPNLPTILFYMHADGQPVDQTKWEQPDPYQVVLKRLSGNQWEPVPEEESLGNLDPDWRLFGRSASDDKGPIVAFLQAMDLIQSQGDRPGFNIKVIIDSEEEIGSKPLAAAVRRYKKQLAADALIINDGPVHLSGQPTLTFGCRGIMTLNLTVYGASKPQHSGHYGNYAPNPVFRLARLMATMKDDEGRVLIDGYYDGIELDEQTRGVLAAVPDDLDAIHQLLQIHSPERVGENYQESLQYPSFNARGISAGWVGAQARTIVPDNATVAIDIRLVPESDPKKLVAAIKAHIAKQGYHIIDHEPSFNDRMNHPKLIFMHASGATLPFRTDLSASVGEWLEQVIVQSFHTEPVKIRIMGGTVPIAAFINELDIPAVIVPMVNPDNNQHSPNENFRIGHFQRSIQMFHSILRSSPKL